MHYPHVRRRLEDVIGRFTMRLGETVTGSPELFLPVFLLLTWKVTSVASSPKSLILALPLTGVLLVYSGRVLDRNAWLVRLGWICPRRRLWLWSIFAGLAAAGAVSTIARLSHESLGPFPRINQLMLASISGPMAEELLFRGLLFWLLLAVMTRLHVRHRPAQVFAVLLIALIFAQAHIGRASVSFICTVLTGAGFGAMRLWSQSTVAAALMHGVYNFALCWMALT